MSIRSNKEEARWVKDNKKIYYERFTNLDCINVHTLPYDYDYNKRYSYEWWVELWRGDIYMKNERCYNE